MRITRLLAPAWALLVTASACSPSTSLESANAVVFVGDSLAEQSAPYLPTLLSSRTLVAQFAGGSAPCDWSQRDLGLTADSVVVISFSGNSLTPCMADGAGGFLAGQTLVDKYRTDIATLIEQARAVGAAVLLVNQPVHGEPLPIDDIAAGLDAVYNELAGADDVAIVDAGAAVENPDGTFTRELPCLSDEPECDPSGVNIVRSDDGLHFCPGESPNGPCPAYSSGAYRFAKAIADAIVNS